MEKVKKNPAVALIRVASMILVILCHIVRYFTFLPGNEFLGQIFNVGVYTFFLISGFLFGEREIRGFRVWIAKRWEKLIVPMLVVVLLDFCCLAVANFCPELKKLLIFILNLQGLGFLSWKYFSPLDPGIINLGPLWFVTIIMLCYYLVPAMQSSRQQLLGNGKNHSQTILLFTLLFLISFCFEAWLDICLIYFLVFYIGYAFGATKSHLRWISVKKYVLV